MARDSDDDELLDPRELYRCGWIDSRPFGAGLAVVHDRGGRAAHVMPAGLADALLRCKSFETLDDHASDAAQRQGLSTVHAAELRQKLGELADQGMLTCYEDLRQGLVARARPREESLSTIGIVTCDRVPTLRRCISSYGRNAKHNNRDVELAVIDDSTDASTRAAARTMLRDVRDELGLTITYAGEEEKRSYVDLICDANNDDLRGLLEFALFDPFDGGPTYGANRNAFLLHTVGRLALSADDDTACRLARSPAFDDVVSLTSEVDASEWWFFDDRDSALAAAKDDSVDLVGLHDALLGHSLGTCVAAMTDEDYLDMDELGGAFLHHLLTKDTEIKLTAMGQAGDSGTASLEHYLQTSGASRERLMSSEAEYRRCRKSRSVLRATPYTSIGDRQGFMTGVSGIDNRGLMPPFFPVGRGEDLSFSIILRGCWPGSVLACVPWAVFHDPPEARSASDEQLLGATASEISLTDLLTAATMRFTASGASPEDRMASLADQLIRFTTRPPSAVEDLVRSQRLESLGARVVFLEGLVGMYGGKPSWWVEDVQRSIAHYRKQAVEPLRMDTQTAGLSRLIAEFGGLLRRWPDIVERARALAASGVRMAQPV